jgi:hypothetical protein
LPPAGNYGEAGAIDLYGPALGLPKAISGIDSYWLRGYGDPPPQTLIVVGISRGFLEQNFESCKLAGHVTNRYGVENEESITRISSSAANSASPGPFSGNNFSTTDDSTRGTWKWQARSSLWFGQASILTK